MDNRWRRAVNKLREKIGKPSASEGGDAEYGEAVTAVASLEVMAKELVRAIPELVATMDKYAEQSAKMAAIFDAFFNGAAAADGHGDGRGRELGEGAGASSTRDQDVYGMAAGGLSGGARLVTARHGRLVSQLRQGVPVLEAFLGAYGEIKGVVRRRAELWSVYKSARKGVAKGRVAKGSADAAWAAFSAYNETAKADLHTLAGRAHEWFAPVFDAVARAQVYLACGLRDAYLSDVASHVVLAGVPVVPSNPFKASASTLAAVDAGDVTLPPHPSPWDVQDSSLDLADSLVADDVLDLDSHLPRRALAPATPASTPPLRRPSLDTGLALPSPRSRSAAPFPSAARRASADVRLSRAISESSFILDLDAPSDDSSSDDDAAPDVDRDAPPPDRPPSSPPTAPPPTDRPVPPRRPLPPSPHA